MVVPSELGDIKVHKSMGGNYGRQFGTLALSKDFESIKKLLTRVWNVGWLGS